MCSVSCEVVTIFVVEERMFLFRSEILKAAAYFLRSLHAFYTNQFQDCQLVVLCEFLTEILQNLSFFNYHSFEQRSFEAKIVSERDQENLSTLFEALAS